MQIDGHHTLTYIAARLAGFNKKKASIIAYSAQYVDDATNSGTIHFKNGAMYSRISSAHKMLDYRNSEELANHQVWIPYHFLPGNGGKPAGENPEGKFINKLVCKPNSFVAKDMLRLCVADHEKPYALHRLGISMHVYADTWAHQGFAGVNHKINEVHSMGSSDQALDDSWINKIANFFISESFPLGHGAALSHPDRPSLSWEYKNGLGQVITRNNAAIFLEAVDYMCRAMQCFIAKDLKMDLDAKAGLPAGDRATIEALIQSIQGDSGEERHKLWLAEIENGSFSFGAEQVAYIAKGRGSWKHKSISQLAASDTGREVFPFKKTFLKSDWKLFHDALQAYRFDILHDVLPKYGICAA
ncbi:hypothetical protein D8Y20_07365 [Mariprofundus sp. EBB-1]|uniref:DUF6765 family protein n=1 Tax=Mariprofundus sp. EBB-1 TaxID=2650971 RepID=UPI000EF1BBB0|nr:DUF6765 family protein [Mariprofundus sp. EBB-1]RLL52216.1 hypothetical protein D8Y20_07365 [Mariprofundus sp. EBB-1]